MSDFVLSDMNHSNQSHRYLLLYLFSMHPIHQKSFQCYMRPVLYLETRSSSLRIYQVISLSVGDGKYIDPLYGPDDCC